MKRTLLVVIAAIVASTPAAAESDTTDFGPPFDRPFGRHFEERFDRHAKELGLDDETRRKIDALVEPTLPDRRARREQIHRERERLSELLSDAKPDLEAVLAQADAIVKLESEALKSRLRTTIEIRALLTPEQRVKLVSLSKQMRSFHEQRRTERLREVRDACSDEIAASCAEWSDDPRGLRHCLMGSEAISPTCAEQLFEARGERRARPRRPF